MLAPLLLFLLPVSSGCLLVHVLWPDPRFYRMIFKAFLGVGVGLGIWSLSFFTYLLAFSDQNWFLYAQATTFGVLFLIALVQRKKRPSGSSGLERPHNLTRTQQVLLSAAGVIFIVSLLSTANYLLRRRQGDWDAWMMYNRAARFVYLDQAHWRESFSPAMDPIFHADYPLLLAMNIASAWDTLGNDSPRVPMLQSALFAVACLGLTVGALAAAKSVGQAALGLIILWGVPVFVNEGARQMADVPLAFFIAATGILVYLYVVEGKRGLLTLAGICSGLAAWTKNEGSVVVIGTFLAISLAFRRRSLWRHWFWYAAGLAPPIAVVAYFKLFLAPPGDILSRGPVGWLPQFLNFSRHAEILLTLGREFISFGAWEIGVPLIGIIPILLVYFLVLRAPVPVGLRPAYTAGLGILLIQILGYYAAYIITPYDLAWHLSFSTTRIVLQVFPLLLFLVLCATVPLESVLDRKSPAPQGENHASDD